MNNIKILCCLLFVLIIAFSCNKNDEVLPDDNNNVVVGHDTVHYFKYKGKKYEIDAAIVIYSDLFFPTAGIINYKIYFVTKGVYYHDFLQDLDGNGDGLILNLVNNVYYDFYLSQYIIDTLNNNVEVGDITSPSLLLDADFFLKDGTKISLKSGTLNIQKQSDVFEFAGNFATIYGDPVKLYHKGKVPIYKRF